MLYGGVKYTQVRHAIQCKRCLDTLESKEEHDFKWCSCGAVGIDGGIHGRLLGNLSDIDDRRMYCAIVRDKKIWLPQYVIEEQLKKLTRCLADTHVYHGSGISCYHSRIARGEGDYPHVCGFSHVQ